MLQIDNKLKSDMILNNKWNVKKDKSFRLDFRINFT